MGTTRYAGRCVLLLQGNGADDDEGNHGLSCLTLGVTSHQHACRTFVPERINSGGNPSSLSRDRRTRQPLPSARFVPLLGCLLSVYYRSLLCRRTYKRVRSFHHVCVFVCLSDQALRVANFRTVDMYISVRAHQYVMTGDARAWAMDQGMTPA